MIADWLKANKPGSRIIVLDANLDIVVEKDNFSEAFTTLYAGIVDYRPGSKVTNIDVGARTVTYEDGVAPAGRRTRASSTRFRRSGPRSCWPTLAS